MIKSVLILSVMLMSAFAFADTPASSGNPVLDPTAMDLTANPCNDFYEYACGNWLKRTQIPSYESDYARSFSVIQDQNIATLKTILTDYSQGQYTPASTYQDKLGDFYASCMNTQQVDGQTFEALHSQVSQIDRLQDKSQLAHLVARLHLEGVNVFFSISSSGDLKNPTLTIAEIDQGGMGLLQPYYASTDASVVKIRSQYKDHITTMLQLVGENKAQATADAATVLSIETALAKIALAPEALHDPTTVYHPDDFNTVAALAPHFDWNNYFKGLGISNPQITDVTEPDFVKEVGTIIDQSSLAQIRTYLKWHLIEAMAPTLGQNIYAEWFHFNGQILSGQKTMDPRWRSCTNAVSGSMGEALGQAFVAKTFSSAAKQRALDMISHLKAAFQSDLTTLVWLDEPTRQAALLKLSQFSQKIGYPDKWRNYDGLFITKYSYWRNVLAATIFESQRELNKIGGPVDPTEWGMSPQTVNAYYDPNTNSINFPAGILQPPFFSEQANDANNYGAIGMVIGHEMTHGFDTSGSKFNGHGAEDDWWSAVVRGTFNQKAECLENQYSSYAALPGLNVNGKLTITENIADEGGLKLSYNAFKAATANGPAVPSIAGLNGDQQYFVSMGQIWCEKQSDASLRQQVTGDPHSPAKFRVIGTLVDNPNFAAAFNCPVGSAMNPVNRCTIW